MLRELNLFDVPVNVEAVAERLGASIVYDELEDDVSGFLLKEKDVATIAINKLHHPNRQRFTLAHECGHLLLHADQGDRLWLDKAYFFRNSNSSSGDQLSEIQANRFAASLLMPEELIRSHLDDVTTISDVDIFRLAVRFEVSEQAMTLRLISLGLIQSPVA
ncbi:MAG: ImmA/IrrE family metallo-endopeptidase [Terriglobales bacterium]